LFFRACGAVESGRGIITTARPSAKRIIMDKIVLSAKTLLEDSFKLGLRVLESGFRPTMIIALWRGGTPVGMAVQEIMAYCGVEADHIAIRTSSYHGVDERSAAACPGR
jgi:hypoxanthine phosphoribosyltransferase